MVTDAKHPDMQAFFGCITCWAVVQQTEADWLTATPRALSVLSFLFIGIPSCNYLCMENLCISRPEQRKGNVVSPEPGLARTRLFYG